MRRPPPPPPGKLGCCVGGLRFGAARGWVGSVHHCKWWGLTAVVGGLEDGRLWPSDLWPGRAPSFMKAQGAVFERAQLSSWLLAGCVAGQAGGVGAQRLDGPLG